MKKITVLEFTDLTKKAREEAFNRAVDIICNAAVEDFPGQADSDYRDYFGCSKYYAETTPWFLGSCYYDKNKKAVEEEARELCENWIYNRAGEPVFL